jgi:hypothetical protein
MTDNAPRQPKGIPVGGQFAATAHSEPDIALSTEETPRSVSLPSLPPRSGGPGALPPLPPRSTGSGGSGGLPPTGGSGAGGSGEDDDEKRKETERFVAEALHPFREELVLAGARTLRFAARENGTLHVNGVTRDNGYPVKDAEVFAEQLTSAINSEVKGTGGVPAANFLGDKKSVYIDVIPLVNEKEIKFVRPTGLPPLR